VAVDSQLGPLLAGEEATGVAEVDDGILGRALGLAVDEASYGRDRVELEGLIGVELGLQRLFHEPMSVRSDLVIHGIWREIELAGPGDDAMLHKHRGERLRIAQRSENAGPLAGHQARQVHLALGAVDELDREAEAG